MIELGQYCLFAALVLAAYGMTAGALGGWRSSLRLTRSAENAAVAAFGILVATSIALWSLLLTDRFDVEYVAHYSTSKQPGIYKFTAFWGGQSGSLLLWALVLSFFSFLVVIQNRRRNRELMPYVVSVLMGILLFFTVLLNYLTNPFKLLGIPVAEGQGLNPLLQNGYMVIHPPSLYLGYIGLSLPFAFALAALISGKLDTSWIRTTRRWTMVAWVFLTFGIALGGMWAYEELGWGGYWAWDPVENASFMPWLIATAFLHSVMITEKKAMLKTWNFILVLLAFQLSIFGTFITRSGVISSVHSFALSNLGPFFVVFLAGSAVFSLFWIFYRAPQLRGEQKMRSFLSREASFLLNNWLFLSICFAVFWGTVFPILSEWVTGEKISVSAPFFNSVSLPLGLGLLILTGVCPLIAWRKASAKNFRRNFLYPLTVGLLTGLTAVAFGVRQFIPLLFFSACGFVMTTIVFEFYKGARARQTIRPTGFLTAVKDLTLMNKRRYGGFVIHAGVVLLFFGVIASSFFRSEDNFNVRPGEFFKMGDYTLVFRGLSQRSDPEKDLVYAKLDVLEDGEKIDEIHPAKAFYHKSEQPMTEVSIRPTLKQDLYVVLAGWEEQGNLVSFHVFVNPFVQWIWIGIAIMVLGGIFVMFPNTKPFVAQARRQEDQAKDEAA